MQIYIEAEGEKDLEKEVTMNINIIFHQGNVVFAMIFEEVSYSNCKRILDSC